MRFCVIDKTTKKCINVIELSSAEEFTSVNPNEKIAPEQNGEIGWIWENGTWQPPDNGQTNAEIERIVRAKRDRLLRTRVDAINYIRWSSMSQTEQDAWAAYRQALLDIPQQPEFPRNVIWPQLPFIK